MSLSINLAKLNFTKSSPCLSSLSISLKTNSVFSIPKLLITEFKSFLLFTLILDFIPNSLYIFEIKVRISASSLTDEPIVSISHCVNWRNLLEEVGSSLKTSPI